MILAARFVGALLAGLAFFLALDVAPVAALCAGLACVMFAALILCE